MRKIYSFQPHFRMIFTKSQDKWQTTVNEKKKIESNKISGEYFEIRDDISWHDERALLIFILHLSWSVVQNIGAKIKCGSDVFGTCCSKCLLFLNYLPPFPPHLELEKRYCQSHVSSVEKPKKSTKGIGINWTWACKIKSYCLYMCFTLADKECI